MIPGLFGLYVLLDFAFDLRPSHVQEAYRFELAPLADDEVRVLRRDNLSILLIRRSPATLARLRESSTGLQDPESRRSSQPAYAENPLRSKHPGLFVGFAVGTDFGCALEADGFELKEICGEARYDFAGRALAGGRRFRNLAIPDYNFSADFTSLTVRP